MIKASKQLRSYTLSTVTAVHSPLKNQKEMDNRINDIWIHFQRTFKSTEKKKKNLMHKMFIYSKEMLQERFWKQSAVITEKLSDLIPGQIPL